MYYRVWMPTAQSVVDFGNLIGGVPAVRTLTLENVSNRDLVLEVATSSPSDIRIFCKWQPGSDNGVPPTAPAAAPTTATSQVAAPAAAPAPRSADGPSAAALADAEAPMTTPAALFAAPATTEDATASSRLAFSGSGAPDGASTGRRAAAASAAVPSVLDGKREYAASLRFWCRVRAEPGLVLTAPCRGRRAGLSPGLLPLFTGRPCSLTSGRN